MRFRRNAVAEAEPKQKKPKKRSKKGEQPTPRNLMRLEFEMMLKGAVYERPDGKVRQYGITINGATRVVSSGDLIDQATYRALLDVGAIRPKHDQ